MSDTLVKQNPSAPPGFFEAEAAGLRWLAEATDAGGARVARVIGVSPGRIELERVPSARPSAQAAREFGRALAVTHDAGAAAFGAPPDGWDGPGFIGKRPQPFAHEERWGAFYARDRVLPFLAVAEQAGSVTADEARVIRDACELVADGAFDDDEPPARLHGDLWNGNVLFSPDGVVLIDPAAHGGHRETDLAMLQLFGAPFLGEILAGYESAHPLRPGWRERVPVHQLHPLAVHAAGFGRGYGVELVDAARATLALGRH
ncbi:fructosamine kinase family protein [Gryllotalpicola ginsengisoli]|uniref:fructosamine kinase family protein n=1 Tax=Gryllotalpicola ginsengisoli TaxID=444608 RepID=UPI0003B44D02